MKRKLFFLLGILFVICMIAGTALAESWICPDCGVSNDGNFCSNCGAKKPATGDESTIANVKCIQNDNGDTLVTWEDSSSASSYTVQYTMESWDTPYNENDKTTRRREVLIFLIPGVTYQITVSNGDSSTTETYTVPKPIFSEFAAGLKYLTLTTDTFSLSAIDKDPMLSFQVQLRYPMLSHSREYTAKLVLKTPYGYCGSVVRWDSFTLENQYTYVYTPFYIKSDWLDFVENDFGSIPTGEYTFEMYMDGQLYGYASFDLVK